MGTSAGGISKERRSKDVPLEALRGIAALIVVLNHSVAGFLPQYYGFVPGLDHDRLQGSLLYVFFNGAAAVSLFFVLSGYILTRRYFGSGDIRILLKGAVKRWPRLAGPVFVTVFASYLLFFFHLTYFQQAGTTSGSPWLVAFGNAFQTGENIHSIHYWSMLQQGLFLTFFRGDALFDSSLWTMHPELIGSFIAFGMAPILLAARRAAIWGAVWLLAVALLILHFAGPEFVPFPVGVGMAVLLPRGYSLRLRFVLPALLLSLYLLGYPGSAVGAYLLFKYLAGHGMPSVYPYTLGATILIGLIETTPPIRKAFSGTVSAFLGALSFPIYLVHVLVICSAGSLVYLHFGAVAAIASVFAVSILASLPLIRFNDWWIGRVNAAAERLLA